MKAIVYTQYGIPAQLHLKEVDKPSPKEGEVLVKVMASSINSWDADMLSGNRKTKTLSRTIDLTFSGRTRGTLARQDFF